MMPVMDGFTLLKKIKTNLEFSHIPIILLTAKNTLQSRMEGLELGADAYIDKPFSMDLLLTQVTNLLNNRSNMRAYYFNSPIANIKSMAYTKADEKFLKKLNDIIDSHINDVNQRPIERNAQRVDQDQPAKESRRVDPSRRYENLRDRRGGWFQLAILFQPGLLQAIQHEPLAIRERK